MGYLHIDNLYKNQDILLFKECYAMEKIHGTSAHISYKDDSITFFSGGEKHANFVELFDEKFLLSKFREKFLPEQEVTIFGEAYGGKCQGMKDTYGVKLRFVVFDIKIGKSWLSVPDAESIAKDFNLKFVYYTKIKTNMKDIDKERDSESIQAIRNGCGHNKKREGIVLRPLIEVKKNNGSRVIAKHKQADFIETKTPRKVSEKELKILTEANEIADEWVTLMRLKHILGKMKSEEILLSNMGIIIKIMVEDIEREGKDEFIPSKVVRKAIGKKTAKLFKEYLNSKLNGNKNENKN